MIVSNGKFIVPSTIDPAVQPLTATLLHLFGDRLQYTKDLGLPDSIQGWQPNWNPRIGFAWRPGHSNNWVVRSGYGIFSPVVMLTGRNNWSWLIRNSDPG